MSKYKDLIFPNEKEERSEKVANAIDDAENEVVNAIYAAKRALKDAKRAHSNAQKQVSPRFDPAKVLSTAAQVKDLTEDLANLEAMQKSMF